MPRLATVLLVASLCFAAAVRADAPPAAVTAPPATAGVATTDPSAPAAPSAATPAVAPQAATGATGASEAAGRPAGAGGLTEGEIKRAFAKFRKQQRDGRTVYCRRESPLGSRLGSTVCYSEEQVLANARAERDAGLMQSQQNVCGLGSCSPGG